MDLREKGVPFEKKYIQIKEDKTKDIADNFHSWQQKVEDDKAYVDIAEYCYSANKSEIEAKDYSLVPSKYIEFINRDENINFEDKMTALQTELGNLLREEEKSKKNLLNVFKELGYAIKL